MKGSRRWLGVVSDGKVVVVVECSWEEGLGPGGFDGPYSSSSSVRETYSSRHSPATSGIENEKLAGNVCMNAAGQLARGEREGAAVVVRGISWCLWSEQARARTHAGTAPVDSSLA